MISKVNKVDITDRLKSDHHLITLNLTISEFPRGPGYWKLNQSLLTDQTFITKTKQCITEYFLHNTDSADPLIVWDSFKCAFRSHSIAFSSRKSKMFKQKETNLIKDIETLTLMCRQIR